MGSGLLAGFSNELRPGDNGTVLEHHAYPLAAHPDFSAGCSSIFSAGGSVAASDTGVASMAGARPALSFSH